MTANQTFKTIALTLAASASALTLVSAPSAFAVEQRLGGVVGRQKIQGRQQQGAMPADLGQQMADDPGGEAGDDVAGKPQAQGQSHRQRGQASDLGEGMESAL